ncbi:cytochrome P450 76M5-like [Triticum urartu]|uniref:cytochrome P450 76M5-like n=1 Tax=Triticum urartu TaxID=4572 RepID=UPI0020443515|nr:cytochrome P450 76M5-like [Triticum urartu]
MASELEEEGEVGEEAEMSEGLYPSPHLYQKEANRKPPRLQLILILARIGSTVIFNMWAIMRDPAAWERPDAFVPERFLDKAATVKFRGKDYEFILFGSGGQLCPGLPMAERVMSFVLASLLYEYEWRLPVGMAADKLDVTEKFTIVNTLVVRLRVVPVVVT